jgi:hypothetical protein
MERENYYLLLGLSIDPPEQDLKVIQAALKEKQAQWSRLRNHPTKSTEAKRLMGLLPDMKRVFSNPKLRKQEAEAARETFKKSESTKEEKLDGHLRLLMAKGKITSKEMSELARIDEVDEALVQERLKKNEVVFRIDAEIEKLLRSGRDDDKAVKALARKLAIGPDKVRERIRKKKDERFLEIDQYLLQCGEKRGFITEGAITKLSRIYNIKESKIFDRLECPIKKDSESKVRRPKPLDTTLVKHIDDNLKIVGASSLYEFLDMPVNAPLEILQEVSREKEMEIRRQGKKDAATTASGALAGHCIVIFRSPKSRNAYDMTRNLTKLAEFNQAIRVAAIGGKVKSEAFEILVREAMRIGMDFEEAIEYIKEYCHKEKWSIEEKIPLITRKPGKILIMEKWTVEMNPKSPTFWGLAAAAILVVIGVIYAGAFTMNMVKASRIQSAYEQVEQRYNSDIPLERKRKDLKAFVARYGGTEYASQARGFLTDISRQMEERDYAATMADVEKLYEAGKYEEALNAYDWYLDQYPKGAHADEIKKAKEEIPGLIDDRDFQQMRAAAEKGDYRQKIAAYNKYVRLHPEGRHFDEVRNLIIQLVDAYYSQLKKDLAACENRRDWVECIQLTDAFIARFAGTQQAEEVKGLRIKYQKRRQYEADLSALDKAAQEQLGMYDFDRAKQVYASYLEANPEAPGYLRERISGEVAGIENRKAAYLAAEEAWETALEYSKDGLVGLDDRIARMEGYMAEYPGGRHTQEATEVLAELREEKKGVDARLAEERVKQEFARVIAYSRDEQVRLADRIDRVSAYIGKNPPQKYLEAASDVLAKLKARKRARDEAQRARRERAARIAREEQRITAQARRTGRFAPDRDGTLVDRKTGLMWAAVDSYVALGRCIDFDRAREYVSGLDAGGYTDWRLPTVEELAGIYKISPPFPKSDAAWYWSSELVWHGWNKKAVVVTAEQEQAWSKLQIELTKCGAVRPVRNR